MRLSLQAADHQYLTTSLARGTVVDRLSSDAQLKVCLLAGENFPAWILMTASLGFI